jgi:hypothetical protein
MENIKEQVKNLISSFKVKKTKSTGKIYFHDDEDFQVLDITRKSNNLYGFKSTFPMLNGLKESVANQIIKESLKELGYDINMVILIGGMSQRDFYNSYLMISGKEVCEPYKKIYQNFMLERYGYRS